MILLRSRLTPKVDAITLSVFLNGGSESERSGMHNHAENFWNCSLDIIMLIFEIN